MYKHILIATDGSELALKGLRQGLGLARISGAKVTALTVIEPLRPQVLAAAQRAGIEDPVGRYDQQIDEMLKERLASIQAEATEQGVTVEPIHEVDDSPAEAILRTANLQGCDLIVMSSHGRRGLQKLLLGSQTSEVLVKTTVPVLVVR
ncbi:universal stress protein [Paracoccus sp. (in: a-proteobacteria)]